MKLSIWDKDAKKIITAKDSEASHISITLDKKILWDGIDMSKDFELRIK